MIDIYIVGLGISSVAQITKESEQVMRMSEEVLYLDTGAATKTFLQTLCPRVTSLYDEHYQESRHRLSDYHHMAAQVVDAAFRHPPVTFAVHGHPLIAVTAPFTVLKLARLLGLKVECQPGVSAIDTVFADLNFDPVINGIQMYEATDLLLRRRPLQNDVPALIWQIGSLESTLHTRRRSTSERFKRFIEYLCDFYPSNHRVSAVYSAPHPAMDVTRMDCSLSELATHAADLHAGFSLFIPPAFTRPVQDLDLLQKVSDPSHLDNITESS